MDLSIIIVNWNSADYVKNCLASLHANTKGIVYETIVVDNGSFDACGRMITDQFPGIVFLQSSENMGFARANNFGAERAKGKYLLFLNPDTEITCNALGEMLTAIGRLPRAGVLGCRLLNTDLTVQTSCIQPFPSILNQVLDADILQRLFPRMSLWGSAPLATEQKEPARVEVVSGACLMIKSTVFREIAGFSPEYFMYTEDIDLCYKAQRAGYVNYYNGAVSVIHHGGGSSQNHKGNFHANVQMRESISKFLKKTRGGTYAALYRSSMLLAGIIRLIITSLALIPCALIGRYSRCKVSLTKWSGIVRWSLGFVNWAR